MKMACRDDEVTLDLMIDLAIRLDNRRTLLTLLRTFSTLQPSPCSWVLLAFSIEKEREEDEKNTATVVEIVILHMMKLDEVHMRFLSPRDCVFHLKTLQ